MADKKSFMVYLDYEGPISKLSDAESGQLFKALFAYASTGVAPALEGATAIAFEFIRVQMDCDAKKNTGRYHWNWKGGITPLNRADRNCAEYKRFRARVLERDCSRCRACGKSNAPLHVHHLKRFSDYPWLRFDIDNGITLCSKCHREAHKHER